MFDIGFTEIIIIGLVGLIVIGPKRLPEAMRTCAMWIGRIKRTMSNVRRDLENEIGIDEIRRDLRNEQIMAELEADNLADERERQEKERAKAENPHGNSYLDSAYQKSQPEERAEKPQSSAQQAEPDATPQPKDNNNPAS
ncbi:MAG: Sec-independent protein translocase protein TatB [Pseudomonadales bacterium]